MSSEFADPPAQRETFVDYLIKKATTEGTFDNLPGAGRPIPDLEQPYDELWWARQLIEREGLKQIFRERNISNEK